MINSVSPPILASASSVTSTVADEATPKNDVSLRSQKISTPSADSITPVQTTPLPPQLMLEKLQKPLEQSNLSITYDLNDNGSLRSIKIVDPQTHKVVKQFPSEEMLNVHDKIDAYLERVNNQKASYGASGQSSSSSTQSANVGLLLDKKI